MKPDDFLLPPDQQVRLAERSPDPAGEDADEEAARQRAEAQLDQLRRLQDIFQAHAQYGMLILLQGMDAAGKDETIQTVCAAFDPQICHARQFKSPSTLEAGHDYLWRAVQALPIRGQVAVFNRSYYEQVTSEQVYPDQIDQWGLPPEAREDLWEKRYAQINSFERHLVENGFPVVKLFLHISRETERERLLERAERPELQWQLSEADLRHHDDWDAFQRAYEAMLSRTNTAWAPWHIIPANGRWPTYAAVASVLVQQLRALHDDYPPLDDDARRLLRRARAALKP
ncbi:MAG TPA: polyphosphate kinase 2 family protein [Chloroflexaceae bacterium]|nr:polyphosphate kinase 2 family protein [Chloroflexaceae bacterium]